MSQIDVEAVLEHMPTPLVVLQIGTGSVIYANAAARRLPFAYGEDPSWCVEDERGARIAGESLPHSRARVGECFDGRLLYFTRGAARHALRFHCHLLGNDACLLTFDDVSSLHASQQELRQALKSRDELVSMAAHELRSPLGALQLVAERIRNRITELEGGAELDRMTTTAIRQTRRLTVLAGNLLDVSRIRTGKFELEREPAALADIVEEACEPLFEQAAIAHKALELRLLDRGDGQWDRLRMEQVVVNLVVNAIKYGGSPIAIRLERMDGHVELCVADEGAGIPEAQQPRVFEAFERANTRHAAQSLGLGLFIVREIVLAHDGTIALASQPGRTVFKLQLPVPE